MLVEIVTHCYSGPNGQYAKLLAYQLRSLLDHPPEQVTSRLTIFYPEIDRLVYKLLSACLDEIDSIPRSVVIAGFAQNMRLAFQRPIGRDLAARNTSADVIWFADCDYLFGPGCLDSLAKIAGHTEPLFFPRTTLINRDHATGDSYISAVPLKSIEPADFVPKVEKKAIGGIQIVPGDVARKYGYCPNIAKYQRPAPADCDTIIGFGADSAYRRQLGTPGTPIDIPNLFRLRHSQTGDDRARRAGLVDATTTTQ